MNALPYENTNQTVDRLRELGTFDPVGEEELLRIVRSGRVHTLPQGWSLMWERTPADKTYVVLEGAVDIRLEGKQLARLVAGDVIGEVAIVQHRLRTATVVAATPLQVLHFTREDVERLYVEEPAFRAALDRAVDTHVA